MCLWKFLRRRHVVNIPKLSGVASYGVHGHCTACVANSKSFRRRVGGREGGGGELLHDKQPLGEAGHYHA